MPELLNPAGIAWLLAVPLLVVPYLLRERPRRRTVPALFLYRGIEPASRVRLGGRFRFRRLFLLELLLLLLAVAALCRPALRATEVRAALVIDDSASMQARSSDGTSRFAAAQRAADAEIARGTANTWDLYVLSPHPREVAAGLSSQEARARVASLAAGSCAHPDDAMLRAFFDELAVRGYAATSVVGDRPGDSRGSFQVTSVGDPQPNVAITDAALTPPSIADSRGSVNVVVENFSPKAASVPIAIEDGDGREIRSGTLAIAPHGSASFAAEVPATGRFRARIGPKDALAVDDEATISASPGGRARILLVAASGAGLDALGSLLGAELEVVSAERYRPELAAGRDLVIFHSAAPHEPPAAPTLYLLPPPAPFLPPSGAMVDAPTIAFPQPTHPIARYLNAAALRPRRVQTLRDQPGWQALAVASGGAVLLERPGAPRAVVSGIDLLPYLGDRNRPVSILTLNLLSWMLRGEPREAPGAGRCAPLGRTESDLEHPPRLPAPPPEAAQHAPASRLSPLWPALTATVLALLLLDAYLQRGGTVLAWTLRALAAALLVGAWLDPARSVPGPAPPPVVLVDGSRSVSSNARDEVLGTLGAALPAGAPAIVFGADRRATTLAGARGAVEQVDARATDLESALLAGAGAAAAGAPIVLATDGWQTQGDATRALDLLARRELRVYPIGISSAAPRNVAVSALSLPAESRAGDAMRAEILLRNDNPAPVSGRLVVRRGATELSRDTVVLPPGDSVIARPLLLSGDGLTEFSAEFQPSVIATDSDRSDDLAKAWVAASGARKIALVGHDPRDNRNLERALTQRGFRVTSVARADGERVPELSTIAALVLNDVALDELPAGSADAIRDYVRAGGGLAMIGGPRSFGLGGYRGSPIEEALPVRMQERRRDEPRNAVALVIDKSGSMREERRILYAREAAEQLVDKLKDRDRIAVIGFDREAFSVVPMSEVGEIRDEFARLIDRLKPEGGTRLYPALEEARRELLGEGARRRHIIVLSDGLSEDAEDSSGRRRYYDLALALADQGVTISTIALGRDADADFLERLASFGRGAFHETADAASLPEIVLGEFEEHAKEKTLSEQEYRPLPSRGSPLVGALAAVEPRWPAVLGLVETELKPSARRDVGVAESELPLIASWEYGRGRAVAVTTDADGRWSDRWVRWSEWSRLWADVAGWLAPEPKGQRSRFALAYRDGALDVDYSRFDRDPAGTIVARVVSPAGSAGEVTLRRVAAGHYRASFPTDAAGDYRIEVRSADGPITQTPLGYTIAPSLVGERPRRDPNWTLLEEIARRTGGEVGRDPSNLPASRAPEREIPLAPPLLGAAMLVLVLELILRRLTSRRGEPAPPTVS